MTAEAFRCIRQRTDGSRHRFNLTAAGPVLTDAGVPGDADGLQRVAVGLLHTNGQGKALRYHVNVPGWTHGRDPQTGPTPSALNDDGAPR